jgi:hypothetical protein
LRISALGYDALQAILCVLAALSGCTGSSSGDGSNSISRSISNSLSVRTYSLGTTISGLDSPGLVLMVNAQRQHIGL